MDPKRRYHFPIVGFNYRMTNVAAAILCGQLERRQAIVARRREIVSLYNQHLADIPGISVREDASWATVSPWLASCLIDAEHFGCNREQLSLSLKASGVDTRPFFEPLHRLPPYRIAATERGTKLPVTDALASSGLMLPTYPTLTDEQVAFICELIRTLANSTRASVRMKPSSVKRMAA